MDVFDEIPSFRKDFDQMIIKIAWMTGCKADPRDIDLPQFVHQVTESVVHVFNILTVCIDVLAKKGDFLIPLSGQRPYFLNDFFRSSAPLFTACIGYDAVRAKLIAAIHDIHPSLDISPAHLRKVLDHIPFLGPDLHDHGLGHICL